jgi:hypothetical protein
MQLALRGLGAISANGIPYNDTGDGISLDNFQSQCCPDGITTPSCSGFIQANQSRFAGYTPCSSAAQEALTFPNLPGPTGAAVIPAALTPGLIPQTTDPNDVITQMLIASAQADTAQNRAAAAGILANLCATQAATCQSSFFSAFVKPSADCTGCTFDFSKPASMFLVAGIILIALALTKGIVR